MSNRHTGQVELDQIQLRIHFLWKTWPHGILRQRLVIGSIQMQQRLTSEDGTVCRTEGLTILESKLTLHLCVGKYNDNVSRRSVCCPAGGLGLALGLYPEARCSKAQMEDVHM
ncbi:hypothetical protein LAZ67_18000671 [Cordylochernes scorpioides]|uniref:Uncharacterized protein n=1 Tax=Cordylochernes scorpioides TaxID=51811 RepID=A0ABY6LG04_9ARAC|nr:hypothetical protein LAZ67_18000671 [Cordylochernes scorpioides]